MLISSNAVVDHLRNEIMSGALEPGAPIRQDLTARRLNLSRTPIRQALHQLAGEGLVLYDPNRGARVAPIIAEDVRDLFDMRLALEPVALKAALPFHNKLSWAQAEMALDRSDDTESSVELSKSNTAFHTALYQPCGRNLLLRTIKRMTDRGVRAEIVALSIRTRIKQSAEEHHALLDACRAGNGQIALRLLRAHLVAARDDTLAALAA